jgi:hypothetical protein
MRVIAVESRKLSWILIDKEKERHYLEVTRVRIYSGFC